MEHCVHPFPSFVQVPVQQFPGYVSSLVGELYDAVEAVVKGRLGGRGALSTLLLCESLLSFVPTGTPKHQPYRLLREYEVVPMSSLDVTRRIDLRPYASTRSGYLYVSRRSAGEVWVPLNSLSPSARVTAMQMLDFLKLLRTSRVDRSISARAAEIIVTRFKQDLLDMNVVSRMSDFDGGRHDATVHDTSTAIDYVRRVFVPDNLPALHQCPSSRV